MEQKAEYVRQLEDACLSLWIYTDHLALRDDMPALADFCGHLHHSIEHEQAMVRSNVWASPNSQDSATGANPETS